MNAALTNAERIHATRDAVADLRRAGFIGEAGSARADALWPEPGPRAGWLGRVLAAVFVSGAIGMLTFFVARLLDIRSFTGTALAICVFLVAAAELLLASPRFAFSGAAGTAGFWAWVALVVAAIGVFEHVHAAVLVLCLAAAGAFAMVFRWGFPLHAFLGTAALFAALARLQGRLVWVIAALVFSAALARLLDRPAAPSHRDALAVALATCLCALYAALNVWSVDERFVEDIGGRSESTHPIWLTAAWWGMLLVPLAVLAWGFASRRRWLLGLGAAFVVLSAITLRHYVHLAALWAVLAGAGTLLALLSLALMRHLTRERWGFTDEPLLTHPEGEKALTTAMLVASQLPAARAVPPPQSEASRFASGGGDSGGGGASDSF